MIVPSHHQFANLALRYPCLVELECCIRRAKPRNNSELHRGFDFVQSHTEHLPWPHSLVAHLHLCRLLDDQATTIRRQST